MTQPILDEAKLELARALKHPYPTGLIVSDWWRTKQAKSIALSLQFTTVHEVVDAAQLGNSSGFDHREFNYARAAQAINFKLGELQQNFPGFDLGAYPELCESEYSAIDSLLTVSGKRLSNIFLTHLHFFLRTSLLVGTPRRILEIGSGYGGLARIFRIMQPDVKYVLVDLPESLFAAHVFLGANFPDARIAYVQDALPADLDEYDFILVPAQRCELLRDAAVDLVVNTGSLQEMPAPTVTFWMRFIQETLQARWFYSWNYFLNVKSHLPETAAGHNLIAPVLDPFWEVRHFRINDPLLTCDARERNWLEVCVERSPCYDPCARANELLERARSFPAATNPWFAAVWMAIWCSPAPELLKLMLTGIEAFASGQAFPLKNHSDSREFDESHYYRTVRTASPA